jgi:DNA replication protein DnaC
MTTTTRKRACPHCGRELSELTVTLAGREMFAGYEPCGCEGARAERAAELAREEADRLREREESRLRAYRRAGVRPRFERAESPLAEGVLAGVRRGRGAYVCGPVGTGKTHLASAVARMAVDARMSVRVTDMPGILASLRATFGTSRTEGDVLGSLSRCDLLVVDDLGKEPPTDWALSQVFRVVNDRYETMRPMVVTTQYGRKELIGRLGRDGDPGTALAIVSRLRETCDRVELTGRDRRIENGSR